MVDEHTFMESRKIYRYSYMQVLIVRLYDWSNSDVTFGIVMPSTFRTSHLAARAEGEPADPRVCLDHTSYRAFRQTCDVSETGCAALGLEMEV